MSSPVPWWHRGSDFDRWSTQPSVLIPILLALLILGVGVQVTKPRPAPRPRPAPVVATPTPEAAAVDLFDEIVAEASRDVALRDAAIKAHCWTPFELNEGRERPALRVLVDEQLASGGDRSVLEERVREALVARCPEASPLAIASAHRRGFSTEMPDPARAARFLGATSTWENVEPGTTFVVETAAGARMSRSVVALGDRPATTEVDHLEGWIMARAREEATLETPAGTFACRRYEGVLRLEDGRFAEVELWLDDAVPVPIRKVVKTTEATTTSTLVAVRGSFSR
jgi:hypothetical protein